LSRPSLSLPADYSERALYVVAGAVTLDGDTVEAGTLAILAETGAIALHAGVDTVFMLLGGEPIDGPRFVWWNLSPVRKN